MTDEYFFESSDGYSTPVDNNVSKVVNCLYSARSLNVWRQWLRHCDDIDVSQMFIWRKQQHMKHAGLHGVIIVEVLRSVDAEKHPLSQ